MEPQEYSQLPPEPEEYTELPGLKTPLSEYEQQRIKETRQRVFNSKVQFRSIEDLEAYYAEYGTTSGENYLTAMQNLAAELVERRRNASKERTKETSLEERDGRKRTDEGHRGG